MADSIPVSDVVCVDDMGKARVMEPVLADKVSSLKDQCTEFLEGIDNNMTVRFNFNIRFVFLQTLKFIARQWITLSMSWTIWQHKLNVRNATQSLCPMNWHRYPLELNNKWPRYK